MKYPILALLLLIGSSALATIPDSLKRRVDSLKSLLNSSDIEKRYAAEFGIAWELFDVDNPVAVVYAARAHKLAKMIGDTGRLIKGGRILGQLLRRTDQPDSAVSVFEDVILMAEQVGDSVELGKTVNALAALYIYRGRFDLALINNLRALNLRKAIGDSIGMAGSLMNTGLSFYKLNNHVEALKYYEQAAAFADGYTMPNLLINIALAKVAARDSIGFVGFADEAMRVAPIDVHDQILAAYHFAYAWHYHKLNLLDSAMRRYRRSWSAADKLNDTRISAESRLGIAQCFDKRKQYDSALAIVQGLGEELSGGAHPLLQLIYYDIMSRAYESKGQIRIALMYRNRHRALNDSITDRNMTNNILMARLKYEEEQNETILKRQKEIISLKEQVISRQQLLLVSSFALAIVLTGLIYVFYRFSRYQKQIAQDLDRLVWDRTKNLQNSECALVKRLGEQKSLMELISLRLHASIATVRGLWSLKVSSGEAAMFKQEFEAVAFDLLQVSKIVDKHRKMDFVGQDASTPSLANIDDLNADEQNAQV